MKYMKKRNYEIDFWKFIFIFMIVIYHAWCLDFTQNAKILFPYGNLLVDFFFIVSSYLMMVKIKEKKDTNNLGKDTWKFILGKIKPIYPYICLAFFVGVFCFLCFLHTPPLKLVNNIFELLQLQTSGILTSPQIYANINRAEWYIASMLIIFLIIYPLAVKYKKTYSLIMAPLFVFITCSFILYCHIPIYDPFEVSTFFVNGTIRAFLSMNLGVITYELVEIFQNLKFTSLVKGFCTLLEVGLILCYLYLVQKGYGIFSMFLPPFISMLFVTIIFSNVSYIGNLFHHSFWQKCSKFGLILYLNHMYIREVLLKTSTQSYENNLIYLLVISTIISIISYYIIKILQKFYQKYQKNLKNLIFQK